MDLHVEDIRAAMIQDYKPTQQMVRTLLKEVDRLTQLCEEQGANAMHYCTGDMKDHLCGAAAVMGTQSTTDWDDVTCPGCLSAALSQAREEVERLTEHRDSVIAADKWKYGEINRLEDGLKSAEQREKGLLTKKPAIEITLAQAEELVLFFGGDKESSMTIIQAGAEAHNGEGLYVYCTDYPEEGSVLLGTPAALAAASAQTTCECQGYHSGPCTCDEGAAASEVGE